MTQLNDTTFISELKSNEEKNNIFTNEMNTVVNVGVVDLNTAVPIDFDSSMNVSPLQLGLLPPNVNEQIITPLTTPLLGASIITGLTTPKPLTICTPNAPTRSSARRRKPDAASKYGTTNETVLGAENDINKDNHSSTPSRKALFDAFPEIPKIKRKRKPALQPMEVGLNSGTGTNATCEPTNNDTIEPPTKKQNKTNITILQSIREEDIESVTDNHDNSTNASDDKQNKDDQHLIIESQLDQPALTLTLTHTNNENEHTNNNITNNNDKHHTTMQAVETSERTDMEVEHKSNTEPVIETIAYPTSPPGPTLSLTPSNCIGHISKKAEINRLNVINTISLCKDHTIPLVNELDIQQDIELRAKQSQLNENDSKDEDRITHVMNFIAMDAERMLYCPVQWKIAPGKWVWMKLHLVHHTQFERIAERKEDLIHLILEHSARTIYNKSIPNMNPELVLEYYNKCVQRYQYSIDVYEWYNASKLSKWCNSSSSNDLYEREGNDAYDKQLHREFPPPRDAFSLLWNQQLFEQLKKDAASSSVGTKYNQSTLELNMEQYENIEMILLTNFRFMENVVQFIDPYEKKTLYSLQHQFEKRQTIQDATCIQHMANDENTMHYFNPNNAYNETTFKKKLQTCRKKNVMVSFMMIEANGTIIHKKMLIPNTVTSKINAKHTKITQRDTNGSSVVASTKNRKNMNSISKPSKPLSTSPIAPVDHSSKTVYGKSKTKSMNQTTLNTSTIDISINKTNTSLLSSYTTRYGRTSAPTLYAPEIIDITLSDSDSDHDVLVDPYEQLQSNPNEDDGDDEKSTIGKSPFKPIATTTTTITSTSMTTTKKKLNSKHNAGTAGSPVNLKGKSTTTGSLKSKPTTGSLHTTGTIGSTSLETLLAHYKMTDTIDNEQSMKQLAHHIEQAKSMIKQLHDTKAAWDTIYNLLMNPDTQTDDAQLQPGTNGGHSTNNNNHNCKTGTRSCLGLSRRLFTSTAPIVNQANSNSTCTSDNSSVNELVRRVYEQMERHPLLQQLNTNENNESTGAPVQPTAISKLMICYLCLHGQYTALLNKYQLLQQQSRKAIEAQLESINSVQVVQDITNSVIQMNIGESQVEYEKRTRACNKQTANTNDVSAHIYDTNMDDPCHLNLNSIPMDPYRSYMNGGLQPTIVLNEQEIERIVDQISKSESFNKTHIHSSLSPFIQILKAYSKRHNNETK